MQKLLGALVLLASLTVGWYWSAYQTFLETPLNLPEEGLVLQVDPGMSLKRLANKLEADGVLQGADYLYWHARWKKLAHRIRAGEFLIPAGVAPAEFLALLVEGKSISYRLTLLEGWNFKQVLAAVRKHPVLKQTLGEELDNAAIMNALELQGIHPEGRFFPDTYAFPRGTTDVQFLQRAYPGARW